MDPAVGVHKAARNTINDTVNRVAYVLSGGDQHTSTNEHHDGEFVMEPEYIIVDLDRIELKVFLQIVPVTCNFFQMLTNPLQNFHQ